MSLAIPTTVRKFAGNGGKEVILQAVGDLSSIKVMQNMVLVATYIRPEKKGSILLPDSVIEEDIYQGKVGLVLKMGPASFVDTEDDKRFYDLKASVGDWVVYRVGDSWDLTVRNVHCRLIHDTNIRLIINDPEEIF